MIVGAGESGLDNVVLMPERVGGQACVEALENRPDHDHLEWVRLRLALVE